ncbi:22364_t:CDS:2, partial [Rhizophagus irregularis]
MRSTMAILAGLLLYYQESIVDISTSEETTPKKHILKLDDISLISMITWYACRSYIIIFGSSLALDESIFSTGQAYVALSRCSNWNN